MVEYSSSPHYPTPDYSVLGNAIGDLGALPDQNRIAQLREAQLQAAQMQLKQQQALQGAFPNGVPMANGQPDIGSYTQALAKAGFPIDPATMASLARASTEQQQYAPAQVSPLLDGSGATPTAPTAGAGAFPADKAATIEMLRKDAAKAGLSPGETNRYIATAMAESGLKPDAVGDKGSSFGLFQGHVGGLARGGNAGAGLADDFMKQTGMTLEQFKSPQGQQAFDQWVANNWGKYGKPEIFHAEKTPAYQRDLAALGGGDRQRFASLGANDASPSIPPVSAAAGSSVPRASGDKPAGAGAGAAQPLSVASLVTKSVQDPQRASAVADLVAKALKVDPTANLVPEQAERAQRIVGNYAMRTGQPAAPQPAGPIVPQVPLPSGFKPGQEQQAILAIDKEIGRLSASPREGDQRQIAALSDWRNRIAASSAPMEVRPGQTIVDPRTGQMTFQAPYPGGNLDPRATETAAETYIKTGKLPPGIGKGAQGPQEIAQILSRAAQLAEERGINPDKLAENWQAFGARSGGLKSVFQRATGLTLVENEANRLVPRVRELLPKLDHTQYPTINAAINAYRKSTGDENIIKFGISAESLASVYARILKGGGTPTGGETERAHELLDKAWSAGQIGAALDQMELELQSAKQSTDDTLQEFGLSTKDIGAGAAPPATPQSAAPKSGGQWRVPVEPMIGPASSLAPA